jgi:hypothetical protein
MTLRETAQPPISAVVNDSLGRALKDDQGALMAFFDGR